MEIIRRLNLEDIFVFDIETAREEKELPKDDILRDAYEYDFMKETTDKMNIEQHYLEKAGLYPEYARILCISVGRFYKGQIVVKSFSDLDEARLLHDFNEYMITFANDMTRLCGHAAAQFDIPFVGKRNVKHRIVSHKLFDTAGKKPWDLEKTVVDTKKVWQNVGYRPASLISLAHFFGLNSPKDDISGADVGNVFWEDLEGSLPRITTYCEKDVITTANVFLGMRNEPPMKGTVWTQPVKPLTVLEGLVRGAEVDLKTVQSLIPPVLSDSERNMVKTILQAVSNDPNSQFHDGHLAKLNI